MQKLTALLAALAISPVTFAESKKAASEFTPDAEIKIEWDQKDNANFEKDNSESLFEQRTKFGGTFRNNEKFSGRVGMVVHSKWGKEGDQIFDSSTGGVDNPDHNLFYVNEAFVSWNASDDFMIRAGRFPVQIGNGLVWDVNDEESIPYSFEGLHFGYDIERAHFDLYSLKFDDGGAGGGDTEKDIYLFNVDLKGLPEVIKDVNLHVIKLNSYNPTANNATAADLTRYGFTVGGMAGPVDYHLTYHAISGETGNGTAKVDQEGNMIHVDAGFNMPNVMDSRFGVVYHTDTGDDSPTDKKDTSYDPLFWNIDKYAGAIDAVSFGEGDDGLTQIGVSYEIKPLDDLGVTLSYDMYSKTKADANEKDDLGNEINVEVAKKYEGGATVKFRVGTFTPGDGLVADGETLTNYWIQTKFNF